jgi:hypothetical protein
MFLIQSSLVIDILLQIKNTSDFSLGVCYFYFHYDDRKSQTAEDVVASLLKQLVFQDKSLPPAVESAYDRWVNQSVLAKDLATFTELLGACSRRFSATFVLLDGLDKCNKTEREKLWLSLQCLSESGVKQFITTRSNLLNDTELHLRLVVKLPIGARDEDVEKVLVREMEHRAESIDSRLREEIEQCITTAARHRYPRPYKLR